MARMTASFVDSDPISSKEIQTLETYYEEQLRDVAQAFATHRAGIMVGSSGTMENIGLMIAKREGKLQNLSVNELEFTNEQFFALYDELIEMNRKERSKLSELDDKRIDLIAPGLILVRFLLKRFSIKKVKISSQALREGIILRYIDKEMDELKGMATYDEPRLRSVMELVNRYDWHEDHSEHVAKLSMALFDEFRDRLNLTDLDRELLKYSAFMHDIGYFISHRKHHKHALYIIRHSELLGFKEVEIEMMANISRYHRRSTPKMRHKYFKKLPKPVKERIKKLSAILRVADGLDRSHYQNVRDVRVERDGKLTRLFIITETDPQLEIWGATRKQSLLEEVLSSDVEIVIDPKSPYTYH